MIWFAEPKLTVGMSDWTWVSAAGLKVRVVGGSGAVIVVVLEGTEVLPVESKALT